MGIIDMFLINQGNICKGYEAIRGEYHYLIAKNQNADVICVSYDLDACKKLMERYFKENNIDVNKVTFEKEKLKKSDEYLKEIINKKLVLLDKKLVLYEDVVEKEKTQEVKGFTGKMPKYGVNRYLTV